jgi:hypothetical protein
VSVSPPIGRGVEESVGSRVRRRQLVDFGLHSSSMAAGMASSRWARIPAQLWEGGGRILGIYLGAAATAVDLRPRRTG